METMCLGGCALAEIVPCAGGSTSKMGGRRKRKPDAQERDTTKSCARKGTIPAIHHLIPPRHHPDMQRRWPWQWWLQYEQGAHGLTRTRSRVQLGASARQRPRQDVRRQSRLAGLGTGGWRSSRSGTACERPRGNPAADPPWTGTRPPPPPASAGPWGQVPAPRPSATAPLCSPPAIPWQAGVSLDSGGDGCPDWVRGGADILHPGCYSATPAG